MNTGLVGNPSLNTGLARNPSLNTGLLGNRSLNTGLVGNPSLNTGLVGNPSLNTVLGGNPSLNTGLVGKYSLNTGLVGNPSWICSFSHKKVMGYFLFFFPKDQIFYKKSFNLLFIKSHKFHDDSVKNESAGSKNYRGGGPSSLFSV